MTILQADTLRMYLSKMLDQADGVVGFCLAYNFNLLNRELKEYDEKRNELMQKYGSWNENGFTFKSNEDNLKFNEEMDPLANYEIELNFRKVKEEDLIKSGMKADSMAFLLNNDFLEV